MEISSAVSEVLGGDRSFALLDLAERTRTVQDLISNAGTVEMWAMPMSRSEARNWRRTVLPDESWVFITKTDGTVMALDEATVEGQRRPEEAVVYPQLHSQLVAWWLFHAWRACDLIEDTLKGIGAWRVSSAAVTGRALLEEAGCLVHESRRLSSGWKTAKAVREVGLPRAEAVYDALREPLVKASFGSRLNIAPSSLRATSVLTYVQKLAKATDDPRFESWYDWLSDAAHPAFGARIALSPKPMDHETRAVLIRFHARAPLSQVRLDSAGRVILGTETALENQVADYIVDSLLAAGTVIISILDQMLLVVDDFGLTTEAALLNRRKVWRGFTPTRGSKRCPCGRGKWAACGHRWGEPLPELVIPRTRDS